MLFPLKISIRATPGAKRAQIKEVSGKLRVAVIERAVDGKANRAIEKALAKYFDVPPSCVRIMTGLMSRDKVVEVMTERGG